MKILSSFNKKTNKFIFRLDKFIKKIHERDFTIIDKQFFRVYTSNTKHQIITRESKNIFDFKFDRRRFQKNILSNDYYNQLIHDIIC